MSETTEKKEMKASRFFLVFYECLTPEEQIIKGSCVAGTDGSFLNHRMIATNICRDLKSTSVAITNLIPITEEEAEQWSAIPQPTVKSDAIVN